MLFRPDLKPDVLGILLDHFSANMPLFRPGSAAGFSVPAEDEDFQDDPADAEIVEQIKELIETRVRPAVANDGGDIIYRGFDKGKVRSEEHTSELQSLMRISYAVFCLKKKKQKN